jgi:hypothetical protein
VLARLGQIPAAPLSGGLAALAQANQGAVARQAEADRRASAHATEADRRKNLLEAATTTFSFIADAFLTTLTNAAPSAEVRRGNQGGWTVRINDAQLTLSGPRETAPEVWRTASTPAPFDVIASATLSLKVPANYHGYEGRSHSLWYADAQTEDQYQWFETAFMDTPLRPIARTMEPFALDPHHEITRRRWPGGDHAPGGLALQPARHRGPGRVHQPVGRLARPGGDRPTHLPQHDARTRSPGFLAEMTTRGRSPFTPIEGGVNGEMARVLHVLSHGWLVGRA